MTLEIKGPFIATQLNSTQLTQLNSVQPISAKQVSPTQGAFQWASRPPTGDQPVTRSQWNASG